MAKEHYGTVKRMAAFWAGDLGSRANNNRSTQISSFKRIWLSCGSPHAIVVNVTTPDLKKNNLPMKVMPAVVESGLLTVEDVRACLHSKQMYLNPVLYDLICSGIESGKLKHYPKVKKPSTLRNLITIAHEAHIRLELWFSLSKQEFYHDTSILHGEKRTRMGKKLCDVVLSDREKNGQQAEANRRGGVIPDTIMEGAESDDEATMKPRIDPKYY
jgi:hypothetical protein